MHDTEAYYRLFLAIVTHACPDYEPSEKAREFAEYGYDPCGERPNYFDKMWPQHLNPGPHHAKIPV